MGLMDKVEVVHEGLPAYIHLVLSIVFVVLGFSSIVGILGFLTGGGRVIIYLLSCLLSYHYLGSYLHVDGDHDD